VSAATTPSLRQLFFGRLASLSRWRRAERRAGRKPPRLEPLEPRLLFSADLVGTVDWDPGAAALYPGACSEATVHVENIGDAVAKGAKVSIYASADGVLDASDVLLGRDKVHGKLKPGATQDVDIGLDFGQNLLPGEYHLIALVDSSDKVHESDEANNVALGPIFDFAWKFGDLPGHHGDDALTFRDADGTKVTLRIEGKGTGELAWDGEGWDLLLTGTDARSRLLIETNQRGDGRFSLEDLHVEGALAALLAPTTDLTGTLEMEEALRGQLVLGSATGATISLPAIGYASAPEHGDKHGYDDGKWHRTDAYRHGYEWHGRHDKHDGHRGDDASPQSIVILGDLVDSEVRVGGGDLDKLVVTGSMISSTVSVGQDPVDGIYDNGDDVLTDGQIDSVKVSGRMSDDSRIVASELPRFAFVGHRLVKTAFDSRFLTELADEVAPTVTIDQATGQADPTGQSPIQRRR